MEENVLLYVSVKKRMTLPPSSLALIFPPFVPLLLSLCSFSQTSSFCSAYRLGLKIRSIAQGERYVRYY